MATVSLAHNKVSLALHQLRGPLLPTSPVRALLLLHGLGEHIPAGAPAEVGPWPGPVWGLDFTGHGRSTVPVGGGYTCELLMADVDVALHHLGEATLYGRGLGAYVALLVAGARPALVRGAILADGPGLSGGGTRPGTVAIVTVDPAGSGPPDPFALLELSRDVRPADYAQAFAREAVRSSGLDVPLVVSAYARPEWLRAVSEEYGVETLPVARALELFAER
ncbi:MAG: alpha/beta hydrolase [Acidimicrobiia bacterium]|nr:alpha/beta hydrolase [Acidimicrobiia bacterium]